MSVEKKILDFDKNELFVSRRVLQFILDNAEETILENDFPETIVKYKEEFDMNHSLVNTKFGINTLIKLIKICHIANATKEQFYMIGDKIHELHFLLSSIIKKGSGNVINWKNEQNLISLSIKESESKMTLRVGLNQILFIDHKEIVKPLKNILKGFFARIFSIYFDVKPVESETQNGFNLTHSLSGVVKFDYVKLISDEEYTYSRIKNYLYKSEEESIVDKINYYLFKDIKFSIDEIAPKLNLSVRSLQRNLKEENISFRGIKENIRKEISLQYLKDETLTMNDVSLLLGYSERSVFEKAFKKWHNQNPAEYRKSLG